MPTQHWLMKCEPQVFSIDDLKRDGKTSWEGVRNYMARNFMRDQMKVGDVVLYYHSNAEPSGVAGIAEVVGAAEPDPTQFNKKSPYFDETSTKAKPTWVWVHLGFVERFAEVIPLAALKADKKLAGMAVLQKGQRLSVMPVSKEHFERVVELGRSAKPIKPLKKRR